MGDGGGWKAILRRVRNQSSQGELRNLFMPKERGRRRLGERGKRVVCSAYGGNAGRTDRDV